MVEPVSRGASQAHVSELELETLNRPSLLQADEVVLPKTSPREIVLWSLAAVMAIIIGVIPALWINRWRDNGTAPRVEAKQPQATATETDEDTADETESEPEPAAATMRATIEPPGTKASKPSRSRPERVKHTTPRARKQPAPTVPATTPPPCDVYLHPKGCPR